MSKENNLTDFLTDIANTLRTQTNTTAAINPQNFSAIISNDLVGKGWVAGHYLPLTGGTLSGNLSLKTNLLSFGTGEHGDADTTIKAGYLSIQKSTAENDLLTYDDGSFSIRKGNNSFHFSDSVYFSCNDNSYTFKSDGIYFSGGPDNNWTLSGISDSTGTSSTIAASQKCLTDNYFPLSGGELDNDSYLMIAKSSDDNKTIVLDGDGLRFISGDGGANSASLFGISDSKGTSSDVAVSQKCLADNYLPLSGGTVSGELKVQQSAATNYGATTYTVDLNKGNLSLKFASDIINFSTDVSYDLISTPRIETNEILVKGTRTVRLDEGLIISGNSGTISLGNESCDITKTENYTTKKMSLLLDKIEYYDNEDDGPKWTFAGTVFSTTDLVAGSSALPSNQLYFVYE